MIPVNNKHIAPCSPISSNCVIWQGPDIPCIGICNGDTVSDVVGKLGDELCSIIDATCQCNPDLSGLDLSCLPVNTPLNLEAVLQAIIDYVCSLNPGGGGSLPNITLPTCLRYNDPLGNPVTQLPLDQFAILLGNKICLILSDITNLQVAVASLQSRVTILENCVLPCTPSTPGGDIDILSDCLFPGTLVPISQLVSALEDGFCAFRDAVGSITLINSAISSQCLFGTTPKLSGNGNYGSTAGWVNTPTTLAESNINQWLVICDLYAAIKSIQDNCCVTGCNGVTFDVTYTTIDQNNDGVVEALALDFSGSNIPSGFTDCNGVTIMTITDSIGTSITVPVNVTSASMGSSVNVSLSGLNTLAAITLSIPFCVTDNTSQCSDKQTVIIPLNIPCPAVTATSALNDITVSFPNTLGTSAIYSIVAIDTTTGATLGQTIITNPAALVTHTFGGAIAGRTYNIIVTVTQGSSTKTCPATSVVAQGGTTGYIITFCKDNTTANVTWTGPAPTVGTVYKWSDGVQFTDACITVTAGPLNLQTIAYNVSNSDIVSQTNCTVCEAVTPSFNCVSGNCVDPGDGTGTYATLLDCQLNCISPAPVSYDCQSGNCVDPGDGSGAYMTLAACQAACPTISLGSAICRKNNCNDNAACTVEYDVNTTNAPAGSYIDVVITTPSPAATVSITNSSPSAGVLSFFESVGSAAPVYFALELKTSGGVVIANSTGYLSHQSFWPSLPLCSIPNPSVTGASGYMEPCIGGTIDDHMGAAVYLDNPVSVDTTFDIQIGYTNPNGSCNNPLSLQNITVEILAGDTSSNFSACNNGVYIPSGALICTACISSCSNPDVDISAYVC